MKKLVMLFALLFPVVALAQAVVPDPDAGIGSFAAALFAAFQAKNWALVVAFVLVGLVWAARKLGSKKWPWLATDRGGALLSLIAGLGASVAAAATSSGSHTVLQVLGTGLLAAITSSGSYALLRKLLFPSGSEQAQEIRAAEPAAEAAEAKAAEATPGSAADKLTEALK